MADKDWDDVPYVDGDCVRDEPEWNDMVDYIKHSGSCADGGGYTLYDDDDSTTIWFEFYEHSIDINEDRAIYINDDNSFFGHGAGDNIAAGTNNTLVGHDVMQANDISGCVGLGYEAGLNNAADNRLYINNSDSVFPLIYGEFDNDIVKFGNNGDDWFLQVSTTGTKTTIEGGGTTGDDLTMKANSVNAYPLFGMLGNSHMYISVPLTASFYVNHGVNKSLNVSYAANVTTVRGGNVTGDDLILKGNNVDGDKITVEGAGDIFLEPTGLVKFGTYAAIVAETLQGYVTIKDEAGNSRKVAVVA